jgi:hypothetical protein
MKIGIQAKITVEMPEIKTFKTDTLKDLNHPDYVYIWVEKK